MTFISYAQNFEDVMLWRALKGVENGCYVDIGAQDPVKDSVSLAFYQRGWRGVNVDASPICAAALRAARPQDRVVQAAVTTATETITFYEFPDTGLSTGDREIALRHIASGFECKKIDVPSRTLDSILEEIEQTEIHWLKIDVEGMERDVLESWSGKRQPWLVVVEATGPGSMLRTEEKWEPLVLERGYKFMFFDGLNRFYLHASQGHLAQHFESGPNVFDGFVLSGLSSAPFTRHVEAAKERDYLVLQGKVAAAEQDVSELREQLAAAGRDGSKLREQLAAAERDGSKLREQLAAAERDGSKLRKQVAAAERDGSELRKQLAATKHDCSELRDQVTKVERTNVEIQGRATVAEQNVAELQDQLSTSIARLEQHRTSISWRITAPLRSARRLVHGLVAKAKVAGRIFGHYPTLRSRIEPGLQHDNPTAEHAEVDTPRELAPSEATGMGGFQQPVETTKRPTAELVAELTRRFKRLERLP